MTKRIQLLISLSFAAIVHCADQKTSEQTILAEGKTKIIWSHETDNNLVIIESKDNISAGNGAKRDVISHKAELATDTTCNVFRLLKACDLPIAFCEQRDATRFVAPHCEMILYEVVVRREAHGSYLKRHPYLQKGHLFPQLVVEFFLKTNNNNWKGQAIPCDDPYIRFQDGKGLLFRPDKPICGQEPFLTLEDFPCKNKPEMFDQMATMAKKAFLILEKAWQTNSSTLVDFKVEFGFDKKGNLLLADVIDNDSWRVIHNGNYIDKQVYRDGGNLSTVANLYKQVRDFTSHFHVPHQAIILWRASEQDDIDPYMKALEPYLNENLKLICVTKSMHKDPVTGYIQLQEIIQKNPFSVVVTIVGKSNGAGPILSATTTVPVITVPAGWKSFNDDIWSSLRTPSDVPLMTVLEPGNAVLAALEILAMNNPRLYAQLREKQECRLANIFCNM
ncbi:AIR carboxylase family protein [Candidatus Dependentiae bacterium]|nr:AIR carboxylase family protein [Candidatus Dependentiae bacterium]